MKSKKRKKQTEGRIEGVGMKLSVRALNHLFFTPTTTTSCARRTTRKLFHVSPSLCFSATSHPPPVSALAPFDKLKSGTSIPQNNNLLQVVLVSPQIPGNTGSVARTCAASAVKLHLVEPMGFAIDHAKLKRAGLDYWPYVVVKVHPSWTHFRDYFLLQDGDKRLLAFTKRATAIHSDFTYRPGDWLVFGSETSGLPPYVLNDCSNDAYGGGTLKIPMVDTYVRCLNLSVSVGVAVYEAARQLNYEQLHSSSEPCVDGESPFNTEDIFA